MIISAKSNYNINEEKLKDENKITADKLRLEKWKVVEKLLKNEELSKRLPSIIGIGVEKCGTHALAQFLWQHPMIIHKQPIEAHFFEGNSPGRVDLYKEMMPEAPTNALIFEKTPAYFSWHPIHIPKMISKAVPNAKLLLVLCDPAKRVISDYHQELIMKSITKTRYPTVEHFLKIYMPRYSKLRTYTSEEDILKLRERIMEYHKWDYPSTILTTGFYALHMSRWLEYYNSSNLFIVNGDDLMSQPGKVIEKVQDFLDIPKLLFEDDYVKDPETGFYCFLNPFNQENSCMIKEKMRTRNGKTKTNEETMRQLKAFYKEPNELLYKMIGQRFDW